MVGAAPTRPISWHSVVAIALAAHMDVLAALLSASSLIVSAANVAVAGCWYSGLLGTVEQHILTRQRDARRIRRWDSLGCVGMLTHCDHSRSNANIPRPASKGLVLQSGVTHQPVVGQSFTAELSVVVYPAFALVVPACPHNGDLVFKQFRCLTPEEGSE